MKFSADKNKQTKKEYGKLRKILTGRKGVTLIELVVTFALISLFVVLASQAIASAMSVYSHIQGLNMGRQVSDTLMDKITGQISGAQAMVNKQETSVIISTEANRKTENGTASYTPVGEGESGTLVDFYNQGKSHVTIKTEQLKDKASDQRQLVIYYYPVRAYEEVDWKFDQKMYMGYSIKELKFTWADRSEYPENIMKVDLTITGKYGDYSATRYVECYNLDSGSSSDEPPSGGGSVPDPPVDPNPPVDPEPPVDPKPPVDPEPPVDPDVPPEEPDDSDDGGDGYIFVKGDNDKILNIHEAKKSYDDLYEEFKQDGMKGTVVPAGIYKSASGDYYLVSQDVQIYVDYMPATLEQFFVTYNKVACHKILNVDKIYTQDDTKNNNGDVVWKNPAPSIGNIYFYDDKYYLGKENWLPTKPINEDGEIENAWIDVSNWIRKQHKGG